MQHAPNALAAVALTALATVHGLASAAETTAPDPVARSYRFLVTPRDHGGVLYTATAGALSGRRLPLSFVDDARYWGERVCRFPAGDCAAQLRYNPGDYRVSPDDNAAGDLLTERVNMHSGTNLYDAATWQIAVVLGAPAGLANDAYALASNQNLLLKAGHHGNASEASEGMLRALTHGDTFVYNGQRIRDPAAAYAFRMIPRSWLSPDPLLEAGTDGRYDALIKTSGLPHDNPAYRPGLASWTDYKPVTGENVWAFLLGPLHAARLHYPGARLPFSEPAIRNALPLLGTFAAMQSALGGVYYAPAGTVQNQGKELVDPYFVSVENNFSLYAGLQLLDDTLATTLLHDATLASADRKRIALVQQQLQVLLHGGTHASGKHTAGLQEFLRRNAWKDGSFVQGRSRQRPRCRRTLGTHRRAASRGRGDLGHRHTGRGHLGQLVRRRQCLPRMAGHENLGRLRQGPAAARRRLLGHRRQWHRRERRVPGGDHLVRVDRRRHHGCARDDLALRLA